MPDNLNEQLGAISVVKSTQLMELATDSRELNQISNQVMSSANKVAEIKTLLESKADHELTQEDAVDIDQRLSDLNVIDIEGSDVVFNEQRVMGAECLGLTLRPSTYRLERIAACEGFLTNVLETTKVYTKRLVQSFHEAYTLAFEDTESLIHRFKVIDKASKDVGNFADGLEQFNISSRVVNLLKVNGVVKEDWREQILGLYKTASALTHNYYDHAERELNQIMAYFAGFESMKTEEDVTAYFFKAGPVMNPNPFKECKTPLVDKEQHHNIVSFRSVELMGGRYLIDRRFKNPIKVTSLYAIDDWFDYRISNVGVRLNKRDTITDGDREQEINTFGSNTINHICALSIKTLEEWQKTCQKANKHRIAERDFESIGDILTKLPGGDNAQRAMAMYTMLVRKNQQDLLDVTSDFTRYLVLTLNAIASLCNDSINYAKTV